MKASQTQRHPVEVEVRRQERRIEEKRSSDHPSPSGEATAEHSRRLLLQLRHDDARLVELLGL